MIRYIRTRKSVLNIGKYKIIKRKYDGVYYRNSDEEVWRVIYTEDIKAEADTIEELCDEFVFHTLDGYGQHFLSRGHLEDVLNNKNIDLKEYLSCRTIYGAIWTDIGLLYVAKLNEKGCFELL